MTAATLIPAADDLDPRHHAHVALMELEHALERLGAYRLLYFDRDMEMASAWLIALRRVVVQHAGSPWRGTVPGPSAGVQ